MDITLLITEPFMDQFLFPQWFEITSFFFKHSIPVCIRYTYFWDFYFANGPVRCSQSKCFNVF